MATKHTIIYGDSRNMSLIPNESVQLIVTSPPYWQLKDYGVDKQIGFYDSYEDYINNLNLVWRECFRVLDQGVASVLTLVISLLVPHTMVDTRLFPFTQR